MLKLYDTYQKKLIPFKPIEKGKVRMYNCGPTVYDYVHIGNMRTYVFEDLLRRTLEFFDYEVTQVMNITDVGHLTMTELQKEAMKKAGEEIEITDTDDGLDRMEKAAKREGMTVWRVAQKYIDRTFGKDYKDQDHFDKDSDFGKLNILKPDHLPRATDYIDEQIEFIKKLEAKGFTYKTKEAVYFDISKFPKYEELSGQNFEDMKKGARANTSDKDRKHPADFRLWQLNQPDHAMQWDSPWGKGFPGWHIECSAMSKALLGIPFDIHTGGEDHIKIHHPCEMAQTESAYGKKMANYWLHTSFLTVNSKKMGKSIGNVHNIDEIEEYTKKIGGDILSLRYFYLQAHYRSKQNFTLDNLVEAVNRLNNIRAKLRELLEKDKFNADFVTKNPILGDWMDKFKEALSDDLNTPKALAVLADLLKSDEDRRRIVTTVVNGFDRVFGLDLEQSLSIQKTDQELIEKLIEKRNKAREEEDWETADEIRDRLSKLGVSIKDSENGTKIWYN